MIKLIKAEIKKMLVGKDDAVEKVMIALLSEGHILIEDLPGLGKTTLAKSFAKLSNCSFNRVQFTPDLMPSDLIGVSILDNKSQKFEFQKGPLFNNILLADEINRTSPKTQSSLLEAMEETQVTIDGKTYQLDRPFMVIATENPIEHHGTFPLPEAQLDRFMMRISLGYPTLEEEIGILNIKESFENLNPVISKDKILDIIKDVEKIYVDDSIKKYIVKLCKATRDNINVRLGASPRATVHLFKAVKAKAYLDGRDYVVGKDVYELLESVVSHRIIVRGDALYREIGVSQIISEILKNVEMPRVER